MLIFRSGDATHLWEPIEESNSSADVEIRLNHQIRFQTIDGFGASFTDSAAYLIASLDTESRDEAMEALFGRKHGIGLSILRNPMGACDFSRSIYSYDDMAAGNTDEMLQAFSVDHDDDAIAPLTFQAMSINPNLKLIASPWSAPGWMKTSGSMMAGELLKQYYAVYAQYFVRYIQEYRNRNLEVFAVTPQNEPLYGPLHYPSMLFPVQDEAEFITRFLRPAFRRDQITTRILGYDHNWDNPDYPLRLLKLAGDACDGIAWHWYGGRAESQTNVQKRFPDKDVFFTEGSGGSWIPGFEPALSNLLRQGIEILRHGARTFVLWNIALDEDNGPVVPGFGSSTCRGLLQVSNDHSFFRYTLDYYGLAHFSKFIQPGAVRVDSEGTGTIRHVAFENKDGSTVVVLLNDSCDTRCARIEDGSSHVNIEFGPHNIVSLVMNGTGANA